MYLPTQTLSRWLTGAVVLLMLIAGPLQATETDTEALLANMTLEQKVGQMLMMSFYGQPLNAPARDFIARYQPGAVALFPSNLGDPEAITELTNAMQSATTAAGGPPMLIAVDQEGGLIAHLEDGFTQWPVPSLLAASGDAELAYSVGQAIGDEMRAVGINMNLAPVADLNTNRDNPIIGKRAFGSDPQQVAPIVAGVIRGLQASGVLATAKHFPGHGDSQADSHVELPIIDHDRQRLERVELVPFQASIEAKVGAIMVAHIWYPALDPTPNQPASLSGPVVSGLLRDALGYEGLIMTDALDMDAIDTVYSPAEAALAAVMAGHDLIAIGAHVNLEDQARAITGIVAAVRSGQIAESRIDASVRRILQAKATMGVLEWAPLDVASAPARIALQEHSQLIDALFASGVTIAFDRGELIPLTGSPLVIYPATRASIRDECEAYSPDMVPLGVSDNPTDQEIAWAVGLAETASAVVVFTQNADQNREQQALVRALPPERTVVAALWSPYDIEAFPEVSSYLLAYSPLLASHRALCGLLFGAITPSSRLPIRLE